VVLCSRHDLVVAMLMDMPHHLPIGLIIVNGGTCDERLMSAADEWSLAAVVTFSPIHVHTGTYNTLTDISHQYNRHTRLDYCNALHCSSVEHTSLLCRCSCDIQSYTYRYTYNTHTHYIHCYHISTTDITRLDYCNALHCSVEHTCHSVQLHGCIRRPPTTIP